MCQLILTKSYHYKKDFAFLLTRPSRDVTPARLQRVYTPQFLLTRPSRDVTSLIIQKFLNFRFLLTRPSRDVTMENAEKAENMNISTHTPLAGRDHDI